MTVMPTSLGPPPVGSTAQYMIGACRVIWTRGRLNMFCMSLSLNAEHWAPAISPRTSRAWMCSLPSP